MKQTLKKGFTIAVSIMTALWSVGIAAFAPVSAAASTSSAASGDLVKASLAAVYYVGNDGKRYVFPNEKTYNTWFADFSSVQTITDSELASMSIGGNATYRPGARLVKITTDPKVYMVGAGAALHAVASEASAVALFGADWSSKIDDVPDAFFTNYNLASGSVDAASIGAGTLPTGTLAMLDGVVYTTSSAGFHMVSGLDQSLIKSMVMLTSEAMRSTLLGSTDGGDVTAGAIVSVDRDGTLEGGTGIEDDGSADGLNITLETKSTELSMASSASQNVGMAHLTLCNDGSSSVDIEELTVGTGSGTVGPNSLMSWFEVDGFLYEETGSDDVDVTYTSSDGNVSLAPGECVDVYYYNASNSQSGKLVLVLKSIGTTGAAAAGTLVVDMQIANRDALTVASTDLLDVTFSGITPAGGTTLQSDGTLQKLYGVQFSFSNHDGYLTNFTIRAVGSLDSSNCELRINGSVVSTDYMWVQGRYIVFEIPEASRTFDEGSDTLEVWCEIDGEAGQSVTPQFVWPSPMMHFYDAERTPVAAAAMGVNMEEVAPSITRIAQTVTAALPIAGASATTEIININNVTDSAGLIQDDSKTIGSTSVIDYVARVKIRGDQATLTTITLIATGADIAIGLNNCQVKVGQRNDKAEFATSSVNLAEFNLSSYGSQAAVLNANVVFTSTKKLGVGDWLIVVECDHTTALVNGNTIGLSMVLGAANLQFDNGTTLNFPAATAAGTVLTSVNLGTIAIASDLTVRNLIQNGDNQVMGVYTITGFTHEAAKVTSVGFLFAAGVSGVAGCTTVTVTDDQGNELATSQSLTATATLTFSVDITIQKNAQYVVRVVCLQASSGVTPSNALGTTFATISGNGELSNQAFNGTPATAGAFVNVATNGAVTASQATNQPARTIGPNKELKVLEYSVTASILEGQEIDNLVFTIGVAGAAVVNDLSSVRVTGDGFTVSGVAGAGPVDLCTRLVTGTTITCNFSSDEVTLDAGGNATIALYATGNSFGNIASAGGVIADLITPSVADTATDINMKGQESEAAITPASVALTGRVVLPQASEFYFVKKALPSTLQSGQTDMVLFVGDVVVSGSTFALTDLTFACTGTNAGTDTCVTTDVNDLEIDSTVVATTTTADGAFDATSTVLALPGTGVNLNAGTHSFRVLSDQAACSTGDTVQLNLTDLGWTSNDGASTDTIAIGDAGSLFAEPFNAEASNNMTGTSNLCG
jgi:hypothetical protein